ncbi:protein phosphatase 1 regulatory subunit 12A-like isoform X2 [Anneissia japonica]|uniref:protein phosphatase 1 regulatory subunit 12A-like isoform X2 n=1 Tax=Anneissia japonica TaxID=1529436 RepID=UPI0014259564|nr:protein phosphatase 1 regulatory subunit 12A-like isoform X2 [Anneissia japonica]
MVGNEGVAKMADGGSQKSALIRRHEQLERWKGSELDKEPAINPKKTTRVKFDKGCVFLASCASGDEKEVKAMLDSGTDINYANIDGLTAIHQAVIDEKLDMVEFLIENGANLEAKDNEGWTALHASSSCGFLDITKYLVENGANLSAVNSEGEIPLDLAEDDEMEEYLQEEIDRQGLDVEAARKEEERKIIDDANQWLNSKSVKDKPHPKTGATALHVASAKGYIKALSLLLQAGMDINSQDNDGWTPFHAASHWGQKESAELLVEKMCDMNARNKLGQTAFDLGDDQMVKYLEELKKKQASMKPDSKSSTPRIESRQPPPQLRRRSSVSRMSVQERNQTLHQDMQREREALKEKMHGQEKEQKKKTYESSSSSASESESSEDEENVTNKENTKKIGASSTRVSMTKEVPGFTPKPLKKQESRDEVPPWRQGLRKTGSSSAVPETKRNDEIADRVQRSASSPRIAGEDRKDKDESRAVSNRLSGGGGRAISGSQSTSAILDRSKTNEEGSVRTYMIPAKEDESETTRRARARRERSSRRSTQGVTAEDLEGAEKYVGQCNSTDSQKKEIDNKEMQKEIELPRRRHGVYTKVQTESQDSKDEEETKVETKPPERSGTARSASTSSISRYGDTSSVLDRSSRNSLRDTTYSSSRDRVTSVPCQNCKKLFEEQQSQVEKLEEKLKNKEKEIANQKVQLERAQSKSEHIETKSYDHEKREKRALERKLSELEEEIKTIHQLKQDNQRLKDENGALVRVISKLSK